METGGRLDFGVCAAVDVHYLSAGGARAAAVLAADAAFALSAERAVVVPRVAPYRRGEFYLRGFPPLRAVLEDLSGLSLLVVDGYADLDAGGRLGLGAYAYAEFGIPVIGVAKSRFRTATHAVPVVRGSSGRPLFITAAGMPGPTRRPGPGDGGPVSAVRRTAPRRYPFAGRSARRHRGRPPARLTYADARNACMSGCCCVSVRRWRRSAH